MKKSFIMVLILAIIFAMNFAVTAGAGAEKWNWKGGELQLSATSAFPINERWAIGAQVVVFENPMAGAQERYVYGGVEYSANPDLWFGPKVGWVSGRLVRDYASQDAAILAFMGGWTDQQWDLFVLTEGYFNQDTAVFHGIYNLGYKTKLRGTKVVFGLGAEQVDKNVHFGPRCGFDVGIAHFEVQHYLYLKKGDRGQNVRCIVDLKFTP